jgi:hypothetical protein
MAVLLGDPNVDGKIYTKMGLQEVGCGGMDR